jgi:hypothetical protein
LVIIITMFLFFKSKELGKSKIKHGFFTWKPSMFREGKNHGLKPVE